MSPAISLKQEMIQANGLKFSTYRTPDRGYPLLYCLHGGPGLGSASLMPGILSLAPIFDLILIDQRGEGGTGVPEDGDYSLVSYARDVLMLRSKLGHTGLRPIGLFGHSFGGSVAIQTLASHPTAFDFGILCNAPVSDEWMGGLDALIQKLNDPVLNAAQKRFSKDRTQDSGYRDLMLGNSIIYFPELTREAATKVMDKWVYRVKPYIYAAKNTFPGMNLLAQCQQIEVPCLVIGSSGDEIIPWSHLQKLAKAIPHSKTAQISDVGHFPFATQPIEFFNQVSQWWEVNKPKESSK